MDNHELYYDFNKNNEPKIQNCKNDNNINITKNTVPYAIKAKIGLYCIILFIILSQKNTYKILDFLIKTFRKDTNDIIDQDNNPLIFGLGIMSLIFAIIIIFLV